jgi:hypothetical protein
MSKTMNKTASKIGEKFQATAISQVGIEAWCGKGTYVCVDFNNGLPVWRSLEWSKWAQDVAAAA